MERERRHPFEMTESFRVNVGTAKDILINDPNIDSAEIPDSGGMVLVRSGSESGRSAVSSVDLDGNTYYICEK